MIVGLGLGITAAGHFVVTAEAEVIRGKKGVAAIGTAQVDTAQSKFGGASLLLDGNSDSLQIPTDSDLQFTSTESWTLEAWIRPTSVTSFKPIFSNLQNSGGYPGYTLGIGLFTTGKIAFYDGGNWREFNSTVSTNTWYHVAIISDAGSGKMFLDGTEQTVTFTVPSNILNTTRPLRIGTDDVNSGYFAGHIDEVRISNTARYTTGFTPSTTPFVNDENTLLLLHMDGTDGSTVFEDDNGVREKKGFAALATAQIDTAQSKFGGASLLLDGNSDYIYSYNISDFQFNDSGDFTVEAWVRYASLGTSFIASGNTNGSWFFGTEDSTKIGFGRAGIAWDLSVTHGMSTNTWYHVAWCRSGTTHRVFVNGTQVGTRTTSLTYNLQTTSPLLIGAQNPFYTNGHIDEVRISNSARYTANFTAPTAPFVNDDDTVLLLHMDGTDGSTHFEDDNGVRAKKGVTAAGNAQIDTAQSKFGGSSYLGDGSGDGLKVSPNTDFIFGTNDWTVEMWYRPTGTVADVLIDTRAVPSDNGITLYYDGSKLTYYSGNAVRINGNAWSANTWQHVAIVRSGNDHKLYMGGTQVGSTYTATNSITSVATSIFIGERSEDANSLSFAGHIDEVRISNTARYTENFTPSTTPFQNDSNTLLLLHMDGTDGSTVFTDDNGVAPNHDYGA